MARAYGANASLLAAFEPSYGTHPSGTTEYWKLPFVSTSLGSEQGLIANDLIGLGRDPSAPIRDVIKVEGDMVVPLDVRHIGLSEVGVETIARISPVSMSITTARWI